MMELKNKIIVLKYTMGGVFSSRLEKVGERLNDKVVVLIQSEQQKKNKNKRT